MAGRAGYTGVGGVRKPSTTLSPQLLDACPALAEQPPPPYWLCSVGSRQRILHANDLSATISLNTLPNDPHLLAVGPVAGLQGEITIYQGQAFVSTIEDDHQVVAETTDTGAIFLAFGSAKAWQVTVLDAPIDGFAALEQAIVQQAELIGLDPDRPFPFRIEGSASHLKYHVIFKSDNAPHNHREHRRAKIPFYAPNQPLKIAGAWSDRASIGRYTHPGQRTHLHVVLANQAGMGHIDEIVLHAGARLFLPKP